MINKTSLRFIAGFVVIIAVSLVSLYFLQTYFSPERQAARKLADIERQYAEDVYGGKTPEETLQLFATALKAGDVELASKYFLPDKRTIIMDTLSSAKDSGQLGDIAARIGGLKLQKQETDSATFTGLDTKSTAQFQATLGRNTNGVWKITAL